MTVVGAAVAEDGKRQKRTKSWEGSCEDSNAFFDHGPESDLAGAEHELCRIAVKTEISESDDRCAACTRRG